MNLRTKLDYWCESIIEAGWLAALVTAPLFFNVFSSRVFEPDKISLIRTIALIMLLAWLVKIANGGPLWLDESGSDRAPEGPVVPESKTTLNFASLLQKIRQTPFLLPVLFLILAYLLSTSTSVARFVSWWGSYQRLQGTYTFLSYVIIASLTAAHLRRAPQLQRLQHTIILTSLPISIYGVVQHYGIDPLPWGGDVETRIAANAGNAIFLAAYLIMAVFLTIERIFNSFAYLLSSEGINESERQDMPTALAGGAYLFVLMVQLLAIFWTQSRGPWLGLLLGVYLFVLLLFSALRPKNYLMLILAWVGVGLAGIVLIVLMNTSTIFEPLRTVPYIGRLTQLLDQESTTAQVRILIWQGAADMTKPHEPLIFPDESKDAVNVLRPLFGYGPEAMWIAYNPFYPPGLAHVEARNASPDRAHNETWDSLVITGQLGFLAYMSLFISIFYWGLRWIGLIRSRLDKMLFGVLLGAGGAVLFLIFYIMDDQQWRFFGVALPAGMMAGLVFYIMIAAFVHAADEPNRADTPRMLLIIALLTTIVAHFVEIHFGIAIAATRTYFWIETAVLLCLGMRWLQPVAFSVVQDDLLTAEVVADPSGETTETRRGAPKSSGNRRTARQKNQGRRATRAARVGSEMPSMLPPTVFTDLLIFLTFIFIYTTNSQGERSAFAVLMNSVTTRIEGGEVINSPALLFLMLFTWVVAALLGLASTSLSQKSAPDLRWWFGGLGLHGLVVWGGWLIYGLVQGNRLIPVTSEQIPEGVDSLTYQLERVAGHFALYTWIVVVWILVAATVYAWPVLRQSLQISRRGVLSVGVGTVLAIAIFAVIGNVNIALVRADIVYKQGQQFDSQKNWISSIELYRRALKARTTEDHYMLFLGRSLLERAKQAPNEGTFQLGASPDFNDVLSLEPVQVNAMSQVELLRAAEVVLKRAQEVNPLNTDHTANLARLYRTWADLSSDPDERQKLLDNSLDAYEMAVTLSPNAAHLWNEKGNAHLARGERDSAVDAYEHSLRIDPLFNQTYLLIADYYNREGNFEKIVEILGAGIDALDASPRHRPSVQMLSFMGVAQARLGQRAEAIESNERIVQIQPNNIGAIRNLAILYRDEQMYEEAVAWAARGLEVLAPDRVEEIVQMRQLLAEVYQKMGEAGKVVEQYELMRAVSPNNIQILKQLHGLYQDQRRPEKVIEILQALAAAVPDNYEYPLILAQRLLEDGQVELARRYAEQALGLAPDEQKNTISQLIDTIESGS